MNVSSCPSLNDPECVPANCRWRCALAVIDELLCQPTAVSGEEVDLLLDLRWKLNRRVDAEVALRLFCELRLRMEQRHYLAFFRIRRWLENHLVASVRGGPAGEARVAVPVKLDRYCVEAVRRACLCAALARAPRMQSPHLEFAFRKMSGWPSLPGPMLALDATR